MHHVEQTLPERLPGLYRAWELALVLEPGADYRIEPAGETSDGTALLAVYRRLFPDTDGVAA